MDAKQNLYEIQMECFEVFKAQNSDNFDVTFDIDGKKLLAHKYKLSMNSPTFNSMLSERWISKNDSIKIENYGFEDFKRFLTFLYSGQCFLTDQNIFNMVDIAEFYGVKVFKKACDRYLSKMQYSSENVFQLFELSDKYSLERLKKSLNAFISKDFGSFIKSEGFQHLSKSVMKDIVASNQRTSTLEEFFEAVFKWAEIRAIEQQKSDETLYLNELIKEELAGISTIFKFDEMSLNFLIKFVAKKSFLFSGDEFSDILWTARNKPNVIIVDENGKTMKGVLNCVEMDKLCDAIDSQKNKSYDSYWRTSQPIPRVPSKIIKNDGIEWYLVYDSSGNLAVKRRSEICTNHYLLAELFAENGFLLRYHCKIYLNRYA
uniref:BTB domain-containing protein n=1 Tax=Panagrolaimus sp. PS1159 TaxID=55785 RepID=A0AC35EWT2_9BILA